MITTTIKCNTLLRTLLLVGISLITTLMVLIGSMAFRIPGTAPVSTAYAVGVGKTVLVQNRLRGPCASDPTGPHCNNQDPMTQGCNTDAQTLAFKEIRNNQDALLANLPQRMGKND